MNTENTMGKAHFIEIHDENILIVFRKIMRTCRRIKLEFDYKAVTYDNLHEMLKKCEVKTWQLK